MKNFIVRYERNSVFQSMIVRTESLESAERFFKHYKPDAVLYGVTERNDVREEFKKGMPCITVEGVTV